MTRHLDDLCDPVRRRASDAIARCVEEGLALCIVDTLRTEAEQQKALAAGNSWTDHSYHLASTNAACPWCHGTKSHAIDLAPYEQYTLHAANKIEWDAEDPAWKIIGEAGEAAGMEWGGRWRKTPDWGHLQVPQAELPRPPGA